jgi:S1-C subfamily serine protease
MGTVQVAAPAVAAPKPKAKEELSVGSGAVISPDGYVVTNAHVVGQCLSPIQGRLFGETPVELRLVNQDAQDDLALLKTPTPPKGSATIRGQAIRQGDAIIAIGYPYIDVLSSEFKVTAGLVSSLGGLRDDTRYLQISAPVQLGNSGGPLLDAEGDVVGIVSEKNRCAESDRRHWHYP